MEFVSLDLETTGFSYATCDIIEIGAWRFKDGVCVEKFQRLIKPVRYLDISIQRITGITNEMLEHEETLDSVLPEFYNWLGDSPIMAYNISFDYGFLCHKGKVLGLDFTLGGKRKGYDVLKGVREKYNFKSNKLADVIVSLGIENKEGSHRAGVDAYMTKLVSDRLGVVEFGLLSGGEKYGSADNNGMLPLE